MKCIVCGREFERPKGTTAIMCGIECRTARHRAQIAANNKRLRQLKKEKKIKTMPPRKRARVSALARIEQDAREHCMSYGNWVAEMGV